MEELEKKEGRESETVWGLPADNGIAAPSVTETPVEHAAPTEGRRLAPGSGKGKRKALIAGSIAVAVLAGGYLGLCAYASGERVLPGVTVAGVELSGATIRDARESLSALSAQRYENLVIPLTVGEKRVELSAKDAGVALNVDATADLACQAGKGSFLTGGASLLKGLVTETRLEGVTTAINEEYVETVVAEAAALVSQPMTETEWELTEDADSATLVLRRGVTGQSVDVDALKQQAISALRLGDSAPIAARVLTASPAAPDFSALASELDRQPENATLDPETDEIIPHKLGLALNAADAQRVYESLAEGESGEVALTVTQPDITAEALRISLFRDVLGEAKSKVSGSANRVGNVRLASQACNGVILLPGEQMSYNQTTGQRTWEKGYREAGAYVGGKTVNEVGGGVCQPSSTLYLATLYADLKTVERKNHMYVVGYMPNGMDATVNWPNLDFVFENSTDYPIKIEMIMNGNVLTARILGTKTDENYIKMSSEVVEYYSYETEYKADWTIPQGTTKVDQTPYTGLKSKCYKHYYDGNDNLLRTELVSTDVYKKRNKIVLYNPLDGVEGVIEPITGTTEPTPTPTPIPSESTPDPTPMPSESTPNPTPAPTEPTPTPTPTPEPTQTPVPTPEGSATPQPSPTPSLGIPTNEGQAETGETTPPPATDQPEGDAVQAG